MNQYEMMELSFQAPAPEGSEVQAALEAIFTKENSSWTVPGFYAGNNTYKVRFLPEEAGEYEYRVTGCGIDRRGTFVVDPADEKHHGPVRANSTSLQYADGRWFFSFGTTVYALAHQSDALMEETLETLSGSPFNKVRMCIFPKHYNYNHNNPAWYAFERSEAGKGLTFEAEEGSQVAAGNFDPRKNHNNWDVHHPCFPFWDHLEDKIRRLGEMGIEADLILFHPYDRWGFSNMPQEDNLVYLDYLLRRLSAFPNVWWSLANEYDLMPSKSLEDWYEIECFVAEHDPYHHMLSNHNCFAPWDWARNNVTHVSWQTKQFNRIPSLLRQYGKPVLFDECRYEGNLPETWGNLSGKDMTDRFWRTTVLGGYCTHGETFLPGTKIAEENTHTGESEVVWWARGGRLHGESPQRIAFLRSIVEELGSPLKPSQYTMLSMMGLSSGQIESRIPEEAKAFLSGMLRMDQLERDQFMQVETGYNGEAGDGHAFLNYLDTQCAARTTIRLPEDRTYRVEVIDAWNMTRETVRTGASGLVMVDLPGREYMAVLAVEER